MRGIFALACPWLCRCATSTPKPPTKRTLRRVITDQLVDERTCVIVRLECELSASIERLLLADSKLWRTPANDRGFNRSTQQIDEIVQPVSRSLVSS